MNILKLKYLWLILPFLAMGCEDEGNASGDRLALSHESYGFPVGGGEFTVLVSSTVKYSVASESDWLVMTGQEGDRYSYKADENTSYDLRTAFVIVKALDKSLVDTVLVYQVGKDGLFLEEAERTKTIGLKGGDVEVNVNFTNPGFRVKPQVDWITYIPTKAVQQGKITLNVGANAEYGSRSGQVVIVSKDGQLSDTVTIIQDELKGVILTNDEITVESKDSVLGVEIRHNVGGVETIIPDTVTWVHPVVRSKALSTDSVYLQIDENTKPVERQAPIIFKNGELADTLWLTQKAALPTIVDNGDGTFTVYPAADLETVMEGATGETYILTAGTYTLSSTVAISGGIDMRAADGADVIVNMLQFDITGSADAIRFKGITFVGPGADQPKYFITQTGSQNGTIKDFIIENCSISGFKNSFARVQNTAAGITNLKIDNCIIKDVLGAYDFIRSYNTSTPMNITVTNSTIVNVSGGNFVNATAADGAVITITNNTIVGLNNGGKYLIDANNKGNTAITVSKNIIKVDAFKGVRGGIQTLSNNCIPVAFASNWSGDTGTITDDPQFKDAANGDFTVQNATVKTANVGAPKWLK